MRRSAGHAPTKSASPDVWYSYAIVRVVPRVERGECLNVGVILFARAQNILDARIEVDPVRLHAFQPEIDLDMLDQHLRSFQAIAAGAPTAGPIGELPPSERFHWLTAPRSTIIQASPVHVGVTDDPQAAIEQLMDRFVRLPSA